MYYTIKPASGGYRARLLDDDHELVWMTGVYAYRAGAEHAIALARANAASAPLRSAKQRSSQ
jgi:uncharacterized protein YegP (UPF0339 family)